MQEPERNGERERERERERALRDKAAERRRKKYAEALVSEATNKFIERVLAWRLPDRARLDGPEGDERALENPPGARHGEIGGSHGHGGSQEEEHRKERERERWRRRRRRRRRRKRKRRRRKRRGNAHFPRKDRDRG